MKSMHQVKKTEIFTSQNFSTHEYGVSLHLLRGSLIFFLMWVIFRVFVEFITMLLVFHVLVFWF